MRRPYIYLFFLAWVVVFGCRHEPFEPLHQNTNEPADTTDSVGVDEEETCYDFDSLRINYGPFPRTYYLEPELQFPSINPNNKHEFVYYQNKAVYKYNWLTETKTQIASDIWVISEMDWGAAGWITFSSRSWKVLLLQEDGEVLKQVSSTPQDLGPKFNNMGDQIVYSRDMQFPGNMLDNNPELYNRNKLFIIDLNGTEVDSFCRPSSEGLCYPWEQCSWSPKEDLFAANYSIDALAIYDMDGNEVSRPFVEDADYLDIEWHPNGEDIYFTTYRGNNHGTINKVNALTGAWEVVKEGCENRFYTDVSISPDGDFMIAQKGTAVLDERQENELISWHIVKMDMDGENETKIEIE